MDLNTMKQYIKDGKLYNLPIIIKNDNGTTTYTNDEETILANGYTEYICNPPTPTLEELIENSNNTINRETDQKILNNFVYNDEEFYLTSENQMNFANMYIAKEYLTYPQQIKTKIGFIELTSAEDVTEFYLSGINFVKQCLEDGWLEKAEAEQHIREEYNQQNN